MFGNKVFIY